MSNRQGHERSRPCAKRSPAGGSRTSASRAPGSGRHLLRGLARGAAGTLALSTAAILAVAARRRRRVWRAQGAYRDMTVHAAITVARPRPDVYERCRDPHKLAAVLDRQASVEELDATHSRWSIPRRDGTPVMFHVHITGEVPLLVLAWEVPDGPFPHAGTLRFEQMADGQAVRVSVHVRYRWSSPRARAGGLSDDLPAQVLARALVRLQLSRPTPTPA